MDNNTSIANTNTLDVDRDRRPAATARLARFGIGTLVAVAAFGGFATTTHADDGAPGGKVHLEDVSVGIVTVDIDDYDLWVTNYGMSAEADFNEDGVVDAADYLVWRDNLAPAKEPHVDWINVLAVSQGVGRP